MTTQKQLINEIVKELTRLADDYLCAYKNTDQHKLAKALRILITRFDELTDCPQDRYQYTLIWRMWLSINRRFNFLTSNSYISGLMLSLDDMYREDLEEEIIDQLNEMTNMELKWISQYSRNDKRLADLADEVLDRRSGV